MTAMKGTRETLRDLVLLAQRVQQVDSGRGLAKQAASLGLSLSYTTVNHILGRTYKSRLDVETITSLARLADVPVDRVRAAAGLPPSQPPFADDLPPNVDQLGARQRAAVITLIRVMLETHHDRPAKTEAGDTLPAAPTDYALATRPGTPDLDRDRKAQDDAAEASQDPDDH